MSTKKYELSYFVNFVSPVPNLLLEGILSSFWFWF